MVGGRAGQVVERYWVVAIDFFGTGWCAAGCCMCWAQCRRRGLGQRGQGRSAEVLQGRCRLPLAGQGVRTAHL